MKQHLIFVLYDSITNSIFDSQIAHPLIQQQNNFESPITLISFEKNINSQKLTSITNQYPTLSFIFLKSKPFLHQILLTNLTKKLHSLFCKFQTFKLIARGPIAGYLCMKALPKTACFELVIQARGILAAEYRFTHSQTKNYCMKMLHNFRAFQFEKLEKSVYTKQSAYQVPTTIESVSPALKDYLIKSYNADANMIVIAHLDIPAPLCPKKINEWRTTIRTELNLSNKTFVYCYNGSLKPWQCPQETINFFKEKLIENSNTYLLVLTKDYEEFEKLMQKNLINPMYYKVLSVPHSKVYHYLAACDAGIIFREKNSINWTSRPTKILEYQAVNLPIIHNNTIALIAKISHLTGK